MLGLRGGGALAGMVFGAVREASAARFRAMVRRERFALGGFLGRIVVLDRFGEAWEHLYYPPPLELAPP
jgi:hypothetical protein